MRVKRGTTGHAKHKKILKAAKGFYGRRKNTIRIRHDRTPRQEASSAGGTRGIAKKE
jgi:ribosomal protein L20